jgi:hypothetical protein
VYGSHIFRTSPANSPIDRSGAADAVRHSPLFKTAMDGDTERLRSVLASGSNVGSRDAHGDTALH